MQEPCEVCQNFRPRGDRPKKREFVELELDERRLVLCRAHALIAENSGVSSLEELRELYHESDGQRSYVPRRSPLTSSPPAAEQRSAGRRATDLA